MAEFELTEQLVKYEFTKEELLSIADNIADNVHQAEKLDNEIKSIKKSYSSEIDTLTLRVSQDTARVRDKFEMRSMPTYKIISGKHKKVWFIRADEVEEPYLRNYEHDLLIEDLISGNFWPKPCKTRDAYMSELQEKLPFRSREKDEGGDE
jgi:hypothetical protein